MKGYFKCRNFKKFISLKKVCDEIIHCSDGSDKLHCKLDKFKTENCQVKNSTEIFCKFGIVEKNGIKIKTNYKRLTIIGEFDLIEFPDKNLFNFIHVENSKSFVKWIIHFNFSNIVYLSIINSNFKKIDSKSLKYLPLLQYLDLSNNPLISLEFLLVFQSDNLLSLNISYTKIKSFEYLRTLVNLEILEILSLNLPINKIKNLPKLAYINGDNFYVCCILWKLNGKDKKCNPSYALFQSCSRIIKLFILNKLIWIFGSCGFFLNFLLFCYSIFFVKKSKYFFVLLFFGDILMSSYLLLLAGFDTYLDDSRIAEKAAWQTSLICQIMGTMMTCSIILSIGSMMMITIERYRVITNPFKKKQIGRKSKFLTLFLLIISILISCLPFSYNSVGFFFFFFVL